MPSCANQLNSVLPAVHANGLPAGPSRSPGACPISITGDSTGFPVTTGPIMSGHAWQPRRRVTWRFSCTRADTARTVTRAAPGVRRAPPPPTLFYRCVTGPNCATQRGADPAGARRERVRAQAVEARVRGARDEQHGEADR